MDLSKEVFAALEALLRFYAQARMDPRVDVLKAPVCSLAKEETGELIFVERQLLA
jgi:hypothetical protein